MLSWTDFFLFCFWLKRRKISCLWYDRREEWYLQIQAECWTDDTTAHFMLLDLRTILIFRVIVTSNKIPAIIVVVPNSHETLFGG